MSYSLISISVVSIFFGIVAIFGIAIGFLKRGQRLKALERDLIASQRSLEDNISFFYDFAGAHPDKLLLFNSNLQALFASSTLQTFFASIPWQGSKALQLPFKSQCLEELDNKIKLSIKEACTQWWLCSDLLDDQREYQISASPAFKRDGSLRGVTVLIQDITTFKQTEKQYAHQVDSLQKLIQNSNKVNKRKSALAHKTSRILRQPLYNLRSIEAHLKLSEEQRGIIEQVSFDAESVTKVVEVIEDSFLHFDPNLLHLEKVSIENTLNRAIDPFITSLSDLPFTLDCDLQTKTIYYDSTLLEQHFKELIQNSLKFCNSRNDISIKIKCFSSENYQVIQLSDNGIGMNLESSNISSKLGEFGATFHHNSGLGTGLFKVRNHLEYRGGRLQIQSHPNKGSVFQLFIPKQQKAITSF